MKKSVIGYKTSITKSRSGHYTLTIRAKGSWIDSIGKSHELNEVVHREGKLDLCRAQAQAKYIMNEIVGGGIKK